MTPFISEIIEVRIGGEWYEAEVLDVTASGAYVYVIDLGIKKNVSSANIHNTTTDGY
jgi:hypothetical protein